MALAKLRITSFLGLAALLTPLFFTGGTAYTQGYADPSAQPAPTQQAGSGSQTFPETGKTVQGRFLQYWQEHGGLPQQGYPISNEMQEVSQTNGKTYTVQYFERAVFELHPENTAPNDVLLSLLGVFLYKQNYPQGAPGQIPNNDSGSVLVTETGKRLGGIFLEYWKSHGGLPQQGFPISDEFTQVSPLNGKSYKVQYFERAVFEYHPENQPPFNVLLSQIGMFRYRAKYLTPPTATVVPPTSTPVATSTPAATATPSLFSCEGIPDNAGIDVTPRCGPIFSKFTIIGHGFEGNAYVGLGATMPNGQPFNAPFQVPVTGQNPGDTATVYLTVDDETPYFGIWTIAMEGTSNHHRAYGYFKLTPKTAASEVNPLGFTSRLGLDLHIAKEISLFGLGN